jgi:Tfp pilus assembly PilM family ATPase
MFPTPLRKMREALGARLPRVAVGIDVGQTTLRVAALRRGRSGIELSGLASAALSGTGLQFEAVMLRETVRRACRRVDWLPRRVAMGVPAGMVLVRPLQVPADADTEEVGDEVDRSARLLPVPPAALRLAWAPLPHPPVATGALPAQRTLLMVAARREAVLARQHLAALAGLGRVTVDVDIFAALRGSAPTGEGEGTSAAASLLVDAGADAICAMAWSAGQAPAIRVLPVLPQCPVEDLSAAVADAVRGLSPASAGLPGVMVLAGARAIEGGLAEAVEVRTGAVCRLAEPFIGLAGQGGAVGLPPADAAGWAVAVGLARKALA